MKLIKPGITSLASLIGALAIGAVLLPCSRADAQQSPVGETWECLVNGFQGRGIAYITFYDDMTFEGVSIMTAKRLVPPNGGGISTNPRGTDDGDSRGDTDTSRDTTTTTTPQEPPTGTSLSTNAVPQNTYGFMPVQGQWRYNPAGTRVIGFFQQPLDLKDTDKGYFNLWFKAIVSGQRMTLVATAPDGRFSTYRAIRMREMPELPGPWFGIQKGLGLTIEEILDFAPTVQHGLWAISGTGWPNYTTQGYVMTSSRKRIAFAFETSDETTRSSVGQFYPGRQRALTTGVIDSGYEVIFNVFRSSSP
jgi:hypothetical protein